MIAAENNMLAYCFDKLLLMSLNFHFTIKRMPRNYISFLDDAVRDVSVSQN